MGRFAYALFLLQLHVIVSHLWYDPLSNERVIVATRHLAFRQCPACGILEIEEQHRAAFIRCFVKVVGPKLHFLVTRAYSLPPAERASHVIQCVPYTSA